MPPELPGVGALSRLSPPPPIGPAVPPGPVGPVVPSTAVAPVGTVGRRGQAAASSPLGRSGLDLLDVIGTADLLVERRHVAPVALNVGLETARGALLRGLAAESLATLDAVWERAQLTEEGWYLRSGALTVLGLPAEAERVSTEALRLKPASIALRFMQSLARLASGDVVGARDALIPGGEQHAMHPVLMMQQIIVLARQGHREAAERLLQRVQRLFPDHPAVDFARDSLRTITADHTRSLSRTAFGASADRAVAGHVDGDLADVADVAADPLTDAVVEPPADRHRDDLNTGNVAERALARLGARLSTVSVDDAAHEARMLTRAFSAGGSMAGSCTPEQAHAARLVLSSLVTALPAGAPTLRAGEAAAPLDMLLLQWMPLMQEARFDDAARVIRRLGASIPDAQRRLLAACTQLPLAPSPRDGREPLIRSFGTGEYDAIVQGALDQGPLIPVRLGLALLEERPSPPVGLPIDSRDADGRGWGTAIAASSMLPAPRDEGAGVRVAALLCVVAAVGAAVSGNAAVAVALGLGAAWLGMRRRGGPAGDRDTSGAD